MINGDPKSRFCTKCDHKVDNCRKRLSVKEKAIEYELSRHTPKIQEQLRTHVRTAVLVNPVPLDVPTLSTLPRADEKKNMILKEVRPVFGNAKSNIEGRNYRVSFLTAEGKEEQ